MDNHRIAGAPASMYYIPNFISEVEEINLLQSVSVLSSEIQGSLNSRQIPSHKWISLSNRRLQALPSRLTEKNTLLGAPLPEWLKKPIVDRIQQPGCFEGSPHGINHCLINEYMPGQGIMPHEDGGAYFPVVATVSLSGTLVLDVTEKRSHSRNSTQNDEIKVGAGSTAEKTQWRILQEPRSLLITCGSAYTDTLHGIAEVKEDVSLSSETVANWDLLGDQEKILQADGKSVRTTRISLTFRDVLKVSNIGSRVFGRPRG
jgi:alkylated DNA repair protein alkB homolog 6